MKIAIGTMVLALLALSAFMLGHQEDEQANHRYDTVSREFMISPRSDISAIQIERWGGNALPPRRSTTSLYGDDRLTQQVKHTYESARGRDTEQTVQLKHEDTRAVVQLATEGGLIGLSWDDLQKKISPRGKVGYMHDASWLRIRYQLDAYGDTGAPVDFTFECRCVPGVLRHRYPDVPEIAAIQDLLLRMKELREKGESL